MKDKPTNITFILDRSGSMGSCVSPTIEGFNKFIEDQRKVPGKCRVTLHQFDHEFKTTYSDQKLKRVPLLTLATYVPRGMTALMDAMGRTISNIKVTKETNEIVVVITDGYENASSEYDLKTVAALVKDFKGEIVFLGADIDSFGTGAAMGVNIGSTMTIGKTHAGIRSAYQSVSENISSYRTGVKSSVDFEDKDFKRQEDEGVTQDK